MLLETLRILAIAYLLTLAVGSLFGFGSYLLSAPARGIYSVVRLALSALTLGRLQMAPLTRRSSRRISDLRLMVRDWAEERRGERLTLHEDLAESGGWTSADGGEPAPIPSAYDTAVDTKAAYAGIKEGADDQAPTLEPLPDPTTPPVSAPPPSEPPKPISKDDELGIEPLDD